MEDQEKGPGQPTAYDPKYCQEILEFFGRERSREVEVTHTNTKGESWTKYEERANPLPQFIDFAMEIGVCTSTLANWRKKHPEFLEAYKKAKLLQEAFLAENALAGLYNPTFAIFTAKNVMGWRDVRDIQHSGETTVNHVIKREELEKMSDEELNRRMAESQANRSLRLIAASGGE